MSINKETVEYTANLARMKLEPRELEELSKQLHDIIDFIDKLKEADITGVEPTSHILPINNILRTDIPAQSLPIQETLKNAPEANGRFFAVPKVIE